MSDLTKYRNYIAGKFHDGTDWLEVKNPSTGELISLVPDSSQKEANDAVDAANAAQAAWGRRPAQERAGFLRKLSAGIRRRADEIAHVISEEQGKTIGLSEVEVQFTADYIDYMAEWARRIEGEIIPSDRERENIFLFRKPMGVVVGILPWNFPFFLIARKVAPALVCGNTIVIKPSEETPNNAFLFAEIVDECGLPPGVINFVSGVGSKAGLALTQHNRVAMISFTGSIATGSRIMAEAAKNICKVNLELGGKAPAIVMADADLDLACEALWQSRIINSGQVCNCAERIYVHEDVADRFTAKLVDRMERSKFGNPLENRDIDYGPLINAAGLQKVETSVATAIKEGAKLETGGKRSGDKGYFFEPTVLTECTQKMAIVQNEIFGPVIPILKFRKTEEAINWANDSDYGLTSSVYTTNLNTAMRVCRDLQFGETYVNREHFEAMQGFHAGWRKSGLGGADGKHGVLEYTQTHMVYLQYGDETESSYR